jgi:hypothetical protein
MTESLTGKYYKNLFRKNPIIYLAIVGSILGGAISIYQLVITGGWYSWWWIPLSIIFIGPAVVILFAIILPSIPWIIYIIFRILIELN